jgi:hypothetical protein
LRPLEGESTFEKRRLTDIARNGGRQNALVGLVHIVPAPYEVSANLKHVGLLHFVGEAVEVVDGHRRARQVAGMKKPRWWAGLYSVLGITLSL